MVHRTLGSTFLALFLLIASWAASAQMALRIEVSTRQADGKIVVAGSVAPVAGMPRQVAVGRYNPDGTIDSTFAGGGWSTHDADPAATQFRATAIAAQGDGKIVLALAQDNDVVLMRLMPDGGADSGFGSYPPGRMLDAFGAGLRINAFALPPDGNIIGIGSYTGAFTSGVVQSALVRYSPFGGRDLSFGSGPNAVKLPMLAAGDNELRAVTTDGYGQYFAAGYARNAPGGEKDFLVASFLSNGDMDPGFGSGGGTIVNSFAGYSDEAYAIAFDGQYLVAVGKTGYIHPYYLNDMSDLSLVLLSRWGQAYGTQTISMRNASFYDAGATATSIESIPGSNQMLVAGTFVTREGRAYFVTSRVRVLDYAPYVSVAPVTENDDLLVAAYPNGDGQFVAVGTRETLTGDFPLRVRYFSDNLQYDTDFPTEGADATPNDFYFTAINSSSPGAINTSDATRIAGIDVPTPISIEGGLYTVGNESCGDQWTSTPGTITNGQLVCVRLVNATTPATTTTATVTVGGVRGAFSSMTGDVADTWISQSPASPMNPSAAAIFSYGGNAYYFGGAISFECSLDGAAFASCPYGSVSYSGLAEGTHTFQVRAVNEWGPDATPAAKTWDVVAMPDTAINSGPSALSNSTTATFAFSSNKAGATFECNHDGAGGFTACTSPVTYTQLSNGGHWFTVVALTAAGYDPTPATMNWTVDLVAPVTTLGVDGRPGGYFGARTADTFATFTFTSNEPASTFQCQLNGGGFSACSSPANYTSLADGLQSFGVRAVDPAGNIGNAVFHSWTIDATPPETTIVSGPSGAVNSNSAQFNVSSNDSNATIKCRLDGGVWDYCNMYFNLAEGTHTVEARATDMTGNVDPTPAVRTWIVDTVAPAVTITSGPPAYLASTSATFTFASNDPAAILECGLDYGGTQVVACSSPVTFTNVAQSGHTFYVKARDSAGNSSLAQQSWYVDTVEPQTTISTNSMPYTPTATIAFYASDSPATFECRLDGAAFAACTSPVTLNGLADGSHTFQVRAIDGAGNVDPTPASKAWTVDSTAPVVTITSGPSGTTNHRDALFTFSSSEGNVSFECSLDGAAYVVGCNPDGMNYFNLAEGMHMLEVRARDPAGNVTPNPASRTWSIDLTNPNTTVTSGPSAVTMETSATLTFEATEGATFMCALGSAPWTSCTSPVTYTGLVANPYSFAVYSIDAAGNIDPSPATWSWAVDTNAPETTITGGPSGTVTQTTATFTFTTTDPGATFECKLDGAAFAACTSPVNLAGLSSAAHVFQVRSRDAVGNVDATPDSRTWTVDFTAPDTTITASPAAATNAATASFSFSSTESGTFECKLDASAFAACTSPKSYTGLAAGPHTFQVRAKDGVGNIDASPASFTWTVDTTAPNTTITGGPTGTVTATTATFTFTSTEAGTFECKLDTGTYAACTSPKTYTGVPRGNHTFSVHALDAAGNVDASPATRSWKVN